MSILLSETLPHNQTYFLSPFETNPTLSSASAAGGGRNRLAGGLVDCIAREASSSNLRMPAWEACGSPCLYCLAGLHRGSQRGDSSGSPQLNPNTFILYFPLVFMSFSCCLCVNLESRAYAHSICLPVVHIPVDDPSVSKHYTLHLTCM